MSVPEAIDRLAIELTRYNGRADCPWPTPERIAAAHEKLAAYFAEDPTHAIRRLHDARRIISWWGTVPGGFPVTPDNVIACARYIHELETLRP